MTIVFFTFGTDPRPLFEDIDDDDIRYMALSPDGNARMVNVIEKGAWIWLVVDGTAVNAAGAIRRHPEGIKHC